MEMSERERVRETCRRKEEGQEVWRRERLGETNAEHGGRGQLTRRWWTREMVGRLSLVWSNETNYLLAAIRFNSAVSKYGT